MGRGGGCSGRGDGGGWNMERVEEGDGGSEEGEGMKE
jgi:hypothetical protein